MEKLDRVLTNATIETLTNDHLEAYVLSVVNKEDKIFDPASIEKALQSLRMPLGISDPEARITQYCSSFFNKRDAIGYGSFKTANSKQTVDLLMQSVPPQALKIEKRKCMNMNDAIRNDLRQFMQKLTVGVCNCQATHRSNTDRADQAP